MTCVCGHPRDWHHLEGSCRGPSCPCSEYQEPEVALDDAGTQLTIEDASATEPAEDAGYDPATAEIPY